MGKYTTARLLFSAIFLCSIGCKEHRDAAIPVDDALVITPGDPRVVDLSERQATTRPIAPPAEPVVIEQGDHATLIYTCRQIQVEVLADAIDGLITPEGTVDPSSALNSLVVHDRTENVRAILSVIQQLDRPVDQLLVEARVLEVTVDKDLEYEIKHTLSVPNGDSFFQSSDILNLLTPGASPTNGQGGNLHIRSFAAGSVSLDTFVRLLLTKGKAKILSSPNLIVSPGTEASIITGQEVPIQSVTTVGSSQSTTTQFKRVGIKLRVNLLQLTGDTARLEINPEVSNVTRFISTGTVDGRDIQNPIVAIRNVTSTLSLKDGEILTVGGLLSTEDRTITRGIPILQDIPLLGAAFQSKRDTQNRTQVIFFLRVHVLPQGTADGVRVLQPDAGMRKIDNLSNPKSSPTSQPVP